MKVLFVCSGNTCRSPMAAELAKHWLKEQGLNGVQVDSAGILSLEGARATPDAQDALAEYGLSLADHRAKRLEASLLAEADLVLTMTASQANLLRERFSQFAFKIFPVRAYACGVEGQAPQGQEGSGYDADVSDPFGGGAEEYRRCAYLLAAEVPKALQRFLDRK